MDIAFISGLLATIASLSGLLFAVFTVRSMNKKLEGFEGLADSALSFLRYEEDDDGNPLIDARLTKIVQTFSSSMAQSLKMSLLGSLSGPARLDKGLKGAMAQDIVEEKMPMLNLVGDFLGFNTKKYIGKHPEAMMQLGQMLAPMLSKMKLGQPNNGGQASW